MSTTFFPAADTSTVSNPTNVTTSIALALGAEIEKEPSAVVCVATLLPFTATVAPKMGCLSLSLITFPVIVFLLSERNCGKQ